MYMTACAFLRDVEHGGSTDQPLKMANSLADYIGAAQSSLHIAIYDFRLDPNGPLCAGRRCAQAPRPGGVEIKIAFDHGKAKGNSVGTDPAQPGTLKFLTAQFQGTAVQTLGITDRNPLHPEPRLMHNKYVIPRRGYGECGGLTGFDEFYRRFLDLRGELDDPDSVGGFSQVL